MKRLFAAVTACIMILCCMTGCLEEKEKFPSARTGRYVTKTGHPDAVEVEVFSQAMEPTFYHGDHVLAEKVDVSEIEEMDIIAFVYKDKTYVRRVFVKETDENGKIFFRTAGDLSVEGDPFPVYDEMIIGKVL